MTAIPSREESAFLRASWVNVAANLLKFVVEGAAGFVFGSYALLADAANSLGDVLASLGILRWGRLSYVDPDANHPHGHERLEPLAAFLVGIILVVVALRLLYGAGSAVFGEPQSVFSMVLLASLGVAIVLKSIAFGYTKRVNRRVDSPGLRALSADAVTDIYASTAVAIGVVGVAMGYHALDPLAGGLVSLLILYEGIGIVRENTAYLTGMAPPKETCERIRARAQSHPAVAAVESFRAHYIGQEIEVEIGARVRGDITFEESIEVERALRADIRDVADIRHVHVQLYPDE